MRMSRPHALRGKQSDGAKDESGQSTLEYALVMIAFLSVLLGLGALVRAFSNGFGVEAASDSAPYCIGIESEANGYALVF